MDSGTMKERYLEAMCNDKEPAEERSRNAYTIANIPPDKKKHIKFQVGLFPVDMPYERNPDYALQIENLLEFYVVGVSLGTAWAHPSSGDTVASVMVGGLKTVQNGAFPIHTNDLICIYFDDERDFFEVIL